MLTQWFNHLRNKEEQDQFKKSVLSSQKVLDRLREICYTMRMESKSADYDSPSWAFKQADTIGYNRAIDDIRRILNIKETE